jgi:NADH-quinone oxidoreductase subunit H
MQQRPGPNRTGPFGLLQTLADGIKLALKEDLTPKNADKVVFALAPAIAGAMAFVSFAIIPLGPTVSMFGHRTPLQLTDIPVAVLLVLAVAGVGVYGIVLAGWSSNSKYSLFGGLRASASMISYELSYATSMAAVIMLAGSLSIREVVDAQQGAWFGIISKWFIFLQPLGFIIYAISGVAETNRAPFDFPEAEQELVAGYNTEYSSVRFALFPQAEYINMATMSAVATDLYLGGWHGLLPIYTPIDPLIEHYGLGWMVFLAKVGGLLFFYIWMRWTLPRYRYDQLMHFGWKFLLPAAVINLLVSAAVYLYVING